MDPARADDEHRHEPVARGSRPAPRRRVAPCAPPGRCRPAAPRRRGSRPRRRGRARRRPARLVGHAAPDLDRHRAAEPSPGRDRVVLVGATRRRTTGMPAARSSALVSGSPTPSSGRRVDAGGDRAIARGRPAARRARGQRRPLRRPAIAGAVGDSGGACVATARGASRRPRPARRSPARRRRTARDRGPDPRRRCRPARRRGRARARRSGRRRARRSAPRASPARPTAARCSRAGSRPSPRRAGRLEAGDGVRRERGQLDAELGREVRGDGAVAAGAGHHRRRRGPPCEPRAPWRASALASSSRSCGSSRPGGARLLEERAERHAGRPRARRCGRAPPPRPPRDAPAFSTATPMSAPPQRLQRGAPARAVAVGLEVQRDRPHASRSASASSEVGRVERPPRCRRRRRCAAAARAARRAR